MDEKKIRKLTVRIEDTEYKELQKYAIDNDTSIQAIVSAYVKELLNKE